ncbi:MAG: hypothetical protein JW803_04975 [Endomicrobiales bacterium]|nr:hypothetical protein [Endomicrobiales bacterium]
MFHFSFRELDYIVLLSFAAACAGFYLLYRQRIKAVVFYLRVLCVALMLFALMRPVFAPVSGDKRQRLAVAVDVSQSMKMTGRLSSAVSRLEKIEPDLKRKYIVRYYGFGSYAGRVKNAQSLKKTVFGSGTDVHRSLWDVVREEGGGLSGVLLVSDGNHNKGELAASWVEELNTSISVLRPEVKDEFRDVAVRSVSVGDFAFKNVPVEITAKISAQGLTGKKLTVNLKSVAPDRRLISSKQVPIGSAKELNDVRFVFTPAVSGGYAYEVEAVPLRGEATTANNRKEFSLDIIRDKVRILYLCGQPGPEYAFLRHTLKSDPLFELVSFVILRNPENLTLVPDLDLALIAFPVHNIFSKDIYDFDILILENFTYRRFGFLPEYLANIRNWVTDRGGGLLMSGGENAFGSGGWDNTPVAEVLPVTQQEEQFWEDGFFRPQVTAPGHQIMSVFEERKQNEDAFKNIIELDGCQRLSAKPRSEVLMKHPFGGWAVLAAWEKGRGRVVALGANTTWRWALGSRYPEFYVRFWRNVMRYLSRKNDSKKFYAHFDSQQYFAGQEFTLRLRQTEQSPDERIDVTMVSPSGARSVLSVSRSGKREWSCTGTYAKTGRYEFRIRSVSGRRPVYEESITTEVGSSDVREESELGVDEEFLAGIAERSGGAVFEASGFAPEGLSSKMKKAETRAGVAQKPVWDSRYLLLAIIGLFLFELYLRKRYGIA